VAAARFDGEPVLLGSRRQITKENLLQLRDARPEAIARLCA